MERNEVIDIMRGIQEIKIEIAKFSVHQYQHRTEIDSLNLSIKKLEATQNKFFGFISIIGVGMTAFFTWLFKHF